MSRVDDPYRLPGGLPVPVDDGAASHLVGMSVPPIALASTAGRSVDLSKLAGRLVVYAYPRTGEPDVDPPPGWDDIPGARGCTPEACAFRDHHQELRSFNADVFGLSTQDTAYQQELVSRLHLPFEILSDAGFRFTDALRLPTFDVAGMRLLKRLTLVVENASISKVFYPVFPPDRHADEVLEWLKRNPSSR